MGKPTAIAVVRFSLVLCAPSTHPAQCAVRVSAWPTNIWCGATARSFQLPLSSTCDVETGGPDWVVVTPRSHEAPPTAFDAWMKARSADSGFTRVKSSHQLISKTQIFRDLVISTDVIFHGSRNGSTLNISYDKHIYIYITTNLVRLSSSPDIQPFHRRPETAVTGILTALSNLRGELHLQGPRRAER